uniref:Protein EXORDIUM-like 2 n=1 Tax=Kalanchoe fedtschenkoi TaxID=63787 RepID=A0A7N0VMJ7_KALFE
MVSSMSASLSKSPLLLLLPISILILAVPCRGSAHPGRQDSGPLTYHNGPMLTRNVNLGILWYGQFGRVQKNALNGFIKSLNYQANMRPQVSKWWKMVESVAYKTPYARAPRIQVNIVNQVTDTSFSSGKVLTADFIPGLVKKATGAKPNTVAVIFASRLVTVVGACTRDCNLHGALGNQLYMVVGNPETECPQACAFPFGASLKPPSGNIGADAMVMHFASALAHTVTNPFKSGFYAGTPARPNELASACPRMFGTGAAPGYTGKVMVDTKSGGAFNALGNNGKKFLVPALWSPQNRACWTVI